jgi:hypothetical protein
MTFDPFSTLGLAKVADTGPNGFTLQNATPTILSWTAPNDGQAHTVIITSDLHVTTLEVGGQITFSVTFPDGSANAGVQVFAGGQAVGVQGTIQGRLVQPGSTVTVQQASALTGGAAVSWHQILAN